MAINSNDILQYDYPLNMPSKNIFNWRTIEWEQMSQVLHQLVSKMEKYGFGLQRFSIDENEELKEDKMKTIYKVLTIEFFVKGKEDQNIELKYYVPWLFKNFFIICGLKKIGIYQIYDLPVVYKNKLIKIKNNIQQHSVYIKKNKDFKVNFSFNKNEYIPFVFLVDAYARYSNKSIYDLWDYTGSDTQTDSHVTDNHWTTLFHKDFLNYTQNLDQSYQSLAHEYKNSINDTFFQLLDFEYDIDIFNKPFFKTGSIIEEFLYFIKNGKVYNNINFSNKRVRFLEYYIYNYLLNDLYKLYKIKLKSPNNIKYKVNCKGLISEVHKNSLIQYDSSINPLSEIAFLSKCGLTGKGNFKKENVPNYLRDLHHSMKGIVCPADTGEREGCGSILFFVPDLELGDNLEIKTPSQHITSISIANVPFMEHDDATRLQMASSQQKHAVQLVNPELPLIQSGLERIIVEHSSYLHKTPKDKHGKVVFKNNRFVVVQYPDKDLDIIPIGPQKEYCTLGNQVECPYEVGDEIAPNECIAQSKYVKNQRFAFGRNLKTVVMIYKGLNYEDGIIISDKLVKENALTSLHFFETEINLNENQYLLNLSDNNNNYQPLPIEGSFIKAGSLLCKIGELKHYSESFFNEPKHIYAPYNLYITDVIVFGKKVNKLFPEYYNFIMQQDAKRQTVKKQIEKFIKKAKINKIKKDWFSLLLYDFNRRCSNTTIVIKGYYYRPIQVGDKIGNRHGNKGVISAILPEEQMPILSDGTRAEVIINPLGIISRMNLGQLYELHLSKSVMDLKQKLLTYLNEHPKTFDKHYIKQTLVNYVKIIDKGNLFINQVKNDISSLSTYDDFKYYLENFYIIQPQFNSVKFDDLHKAMEYTQTKYCYDCYAPDVQDVPVNFLINAHDPSPIIFDGKEYKPNILQPIAYGYMYFYKLNHLAEEKLSVRSIGNYNAKTMQPIAGKKDNGGQRVGEMENWCLIAHGAMHSLYEMLNTKSDNIKKRNEFLSKLISSVNFDYICHDIPNILKYLHYLLQSIGINFPCKNL